MQPKNNNRRGNYKGQKYYNKDYKLPDKFPFEMTFDDFVANYERVKNCIWVPRRKRKVEKERKFRDMLRDVQNTLDEKKKSIPKHFIPKSEQKRRVSKKFKSRMRRLKKIKPWLFEESLDSMIDLAKEKEVRSGGNYD
jgi:hypothetical protein